MLNLFAMRGEVFGMVENRCVFSILFTLGSLLYAQQGDLQSPNPAQPSDANVVAGTASYDQTHSKAGEFMIDTNVVGRPIPGYQWYPASAFDGANRLVVWQDNRSGSDFDIYGTLVSPNGAILFPDGIVISKALNHQYFPAVAFDGLSYLVVWEDRRNGGSDVYGARVSRSGAVLDSAGILITNASGDQFRPAVARGDTQLMVVWHDIRTSTSFDIYGTRVSRSGIVLDPAGVRISSAPGNQWYPSVAWRDTNYVVVWGDARAGPNDDIYAARVSESGVVLDTAGICVCMAPRGQLFPAVAPGDTNLLVVWQDRRNAGTDDIYGSRVTPSGLVLDTAGIAISTGAGSQGSPAVVFDGSNHFVVWDHNYNVYGARLNRSGQVLDPSGIPISIGAANQFSPAVDADSTNYLTVWIDSRVDEDIFGARISKSGVVIDTAGFAVSIAANSHARPAVAFDNANFLTAWADYRCFENRSPCCDIYGARVSPGGGVLDRIGFPISTAPDSQDCPSLTFGGANYLAVWQDRRDAAGYHIYGTRISQTGIVLDASGIAISINANGQEHPAVAYNGQDYFVVWQDACSGLSWDISGTRVTESGVIIEPNGTPISTAAGHQMFPALACNDSTYLVTWEDTRNGGTSNCDIYGARVRPSGTVLDPSGIPISSAPRRQQAPSIASDGVNYFVVWQDSRTSAFPDIYGARIDKAGNLLDPAGIAIAAAADSQASPAVAFDGSRYLVIWQDRRNGFFYDICGARISTSGVVFDSFVVSSRFGNQITPSLAHGAGNQFMMAYSGWTDSVSGRPVSTMRIWGNAYLLGIHETPGGEMLTALDQMQICPNPFHVTTAIQLPAYNKHGARLRIYDSAGRLVKEFKRLPIQSRSRISWQGDDDRGRLLPPGVYICQFKAGEHASTKKMVKLR